MLVAELSFAAMTQVIERYGPDHLISPDLRGNPRADLHLRSMDVGLGDEQDVRTYSGLVPNLFVALIPIEEPSHANEVLLKLANKCYRAAAKQWDLYAETTREFLKTQSERVAASVRNEKVDFGEVFGAHWGALEWNGPEHRSTSGGSALSRLQVGNAITCQYPQPHELSSSGDDLTDDEARFLRNENSRLSRIRPWVDDEAIRREVATRRAYQGIDPETTLLSTGADYPFIFHELKGRLRLEKSGIDLKIPEQRGEMCTLCGERSAYGALNENGKPVARQDLRNLWAELYPERHGAERLCAVCSIKRFLVRVSAETPQYGKEQTTFNDVWSSQGDSRDARARVPFPSTAAVALQSYLSLIAGFETELRANLSELVEALRSAGITRSSDPRALPLLAKISSKKGSLMGALLEFDPSCLLPETWESEQALYDRLPASQFPSSGPTKQQVDRIYTCAKKLRGAVGELKAKRTNEASPSARGAEIRPEDWRPGVKLALIRMDGDSMGRLLLGDPEILSTRWRDVLHPDWIARMEGTKPEAESASSDSDMFAKLCASSGWHTLLGANRSTGPAFHAMVSRSLGYFAHEIVPWVVEREFQGRLIYAGGDDVLAMAPACDALAIAQRLQDLYSAAWIVDTRPGTRAWSWRNGEENDLNLDQQKVRDRFRIVEANEGEQVVDWSQWLTGIGVSPGSEQRVRLLTMLGPTQSMSAGIVYGHYKTPLRTMLKESKVLLDDVAKAKNGRGSVALSRRSRGGEKDRCVMKLLAPTNIRRKPSANPFPKDAPRTHKAIWRPCLTTRVKVVAA
jgi:CRISPR-associated protein Cmr2